MRSTKDSTVVKMLLDRNKEQSLRFAQAAPEREQFRARHKTDFVASICMDGRISFSTMTELPMGTCITHRNLGGRVDLGWPHFNSLVVRQAEHSVKQGRNCLASPMYHWSRSSRELGCRGFNYDTAEAIRYMDRFKRDLDFLFGGSKVLCAVMMGIETDLDALMIHGHNGKVLDLSEVPGITPDDLWAKLEPMFPSMAEEMLRDLHHLCLGNLRHIDKVRRANRTLVQLDHTEKVLGYGRGMDWIRLPNTALIVGPFGFDQTDPIHKAATIIEENVRQGRTFLDDGLVLLVSALYDPASLLDRNAAALKVQAAARFALDILTKRNPFFLEHAALMKCIVSKDTRLLELID